MAARASFAPPFPINGPLRGPSAKAPAMSASFRLIRLGDAAHLTQAALTGLFAEDFMPGRYTPA